MKRNLSFWTRYTCQTAKTTLFMVAIMTVFTAVGVDGFQWNLLAALAPYFLVAAASFSILIINSSTQILYAPLLLSMGETRRNVFFGTCFYRLLVILATVVLSSLVWLLIPGGAAGLATLPTVVTLLVFSSALGSITGTITTRWRWVGWMVLALVGGVFGGCGGFIVSGGFDGGMEAAAGVGAQQLADIFSEMPLWAMLLAGVAMAADLGFQALLLRKQEVKF